MTVLSNVQVYGLPESIYRSGYSMINEAPTEEQFKEDVASIVNAISNKDYDNKHIKRAIRLANIISPGEDQFLTGIIVQFDMKFTLKGWTEAQRYHFLDFVSSMSTMHRIAKFDTENCVSSRVDKRNIEVLNEYIEKYNQTNKLEDYRNILDNIPSGMLLTAGMTTNYRCLKNMYKQRVNHQLEIWQEFCKELKQLPMAKEFIMGSK